jgi:hypothetical protein
VTGFSRFDKFDGFMLATGTGFVVVSGWIGSFAIICGFIWLMFAAVALGVKNLVRIAPPPGWKGWRATLLPPAPPLRVLDSMSTMSRYQFDHIAESCGNNRHEMLERFRVIYSGLGVKTTHFTVDRRDRCYDPIGAYRSVDGISPACPAPARQDNMINLFWYSEKECHHEVPSLPTPKVPSPPKAKHIHRGGLGSTAIRHGISKRARPAYRFHGFSHTPDVIPGRYVTGTCDFMEMGYNQAPAPWPEPGAVLMDTQGKITRVPGKTGELWHYNPVSVEDVIDRLVEQDIEGMWLDEFKASCIGAGVSASDFRRWAIDCYGCGTLVKVPVVGPKKVWINF